jgi:hypothetical protein
MTPSDAAACDTHLHGINPNARLIMLSIAARDEVTCGLREQLPTIFSLCVSVQDVNPREGLPKLRAAWVEARDAAGARCAWLLLLTS